MKKLPLFIAALLLALTLWAGCESGRSEKGKTYELILLHTNDHHGATLQSNGHGGLAERATFIKSVRAANDNVLLIDAGDINSGMILSNMFHAEPDILAYNIMGYDAATFGNHEFDGTHEKLEKQIAAAEFPFVSSNIKTANGKFLSDHQYLVKDYKGFRVGLLGITTLRTLTIANPDNSLAFIDEIKAAKEAVALLRNKEKADIIIAITHIGDEEEYPGHITSPMLAIAVPDIDIIVDGHSHSKFDAPIMFGNTHIVTANEWGKFAGKGKLSIANGKLAGFDWNLVEINANTYAPDTAISALLEFYINSADASLKEVIGEAAGTFEFGNRLPRYQETAIGNLITDANVWYFKTVFNQDIDFAFHNGGSIRAELPKGQITLEKILTVLPYENYLYAVELKGSEILELFDYIATVSQGDGAFPQFSKEVRYTFDIPNQKISNLTIGGAPVDINKTYRFCTNDYLLNGGDGYIVLAKAQNPFNASLLLSYAVIEYIRSIGIITPYIDGRMNVTPHIIN